MSKECHNFFFPPTKIFYNIISPISSFQSSIYNTIFFKVFKMMINTIRKTKPFILLYHCLSKDPAKTKGNRLRKINKLNRIFESELGFHWVVKFKRRMRSLKRGWSRSSSKAGRFQNVVVHISQSSIAFSSQSRARSSSPSSE